MKTIDKIWPSIDWFIPAQQRAEEFALCRARIVVCFSFALAMWGPLFAIVYYFTPGAMRSFLGSLWVTFMLAQVPFTLRYTRSLSLAGNCFILNIFLLVSYLSYVAGGSGAPPLAWAAALPMFAVAIVGYRYGLVWTLITLGTFIGFYSYDQLGYRMARHLTDHQLKVLDFIVLCGLLLMILSMTLLYESNQNRAYHILKASNDKLSEVSSHLQAIVNNAADGIMTFDTAGIIKSFNPAAEKLFGYTAAEVLGNPLETLMPLPTSSRDEAHVIKGLNEDVGENTPAEQRITGRRKGGQIFPLQAAVGMACFNGARLFVCIVRDVTDLVIAEEQQRQFTALVEHSSDFIAMAGLDQGLSYLNSAGRQLVGVNRQARVNEGTLTQYFTEQTCATLNETALPAVMERGVWAGEGQLQHFQSGAKIDVRLNILLLRHPQGPATLCIEAVPSEHQASLAYAFNSAV